MIILGIDPGTATTGYGVIKKIRNPKSEIRNDLRCLGYGCIKTSPDLNDGDRLKKINQELNRIIKNYKPKILAIESIYFFKNLKTALPVSQAKGVVLLTAAKKKIPVYEITPLQVKMAISGYGRADKRQVQKMIKTILNLREIPKPDDAADALAVAVSYVNSVKKP